MLNSVSSAKEYYFSAAKNEIHGPIPQRAKTLESQASELQMCNGQHPLWCAFETQKNKRIKDKTMKNFCDDTDGELLVFMH